MCEFSVVPLVIVVVVVVVPFAFVFVVFEVVVLAVVVVVVSSSPPHASFPMQLLPGLTPKPMLLNPYCLGFLP